ncbi:uncharacterized protein LOC124303502 isoform X1 [Neodiprion virginianus]|uniref:uncharacterized protein LOC124303502 isoform X1 n=1 Tax=Neodiprion virginianus TaxID=2961670 RepID=UPI001EE70B4F|nr:uncharacterized protein LOC124303502 isoform X1 [Neodiprion virginianus]
MWLSSRRKLAILAAISEFFIHAEAKYCAFEIHGEPKYYVCPRTEYCCNFGCCVSPGFQIYHLWYYWLLVIIMFLVCSGGGWWYRYWLQGRYRPSTSTLPLRTPSSRTHNTPRGPTCRAQQARVTYNPARNTVLLHRMWKGPQRSATPPAYNGAAASSAQFQNTNVVLNENNCPYYELYGPPPSYETVIAQTRGKITSPTSATENPRPNVQSSNMQNQNAVHCFSHNYSSLPTRAHLDNNVVERRNSCGSNLEEGDNDVESFSYKNFVQKYDAQQSLRRGGTNLPSESYSNQESTTCGTRLQNISNKILPVYVAESMQQLHDGKVKSSQNNCVANSSSQNNYSEAGASGQFTQVTAISQGIRNIRSIQDSGAVDEIDIPKLNRLAAEVNDTETSSDENRMRLESQVSRIPEMLMYSKIDSSGEKCHRGQSGSLNRRSGGSSQWGETSETYNNMYTHRITNLEDHKRTEGLSYMKIDIDHVKSSTSSKRNKFFSDCEECEAQNGESTSHLNPSNNVILPSPNSNIQINSSPPINVIENYQHYPPTSLSPPAQRSNTSTNFESENKLGRSKSLD